MNISLRLTPGQAEAIARVVCADRNQEGYDEQDHVQAMATLSQIACQAAFHRTCIGKVDCPECVKVFELDYAAHKPVRRGMAARRNNCGP